jgi:hypothetical protein
VDILKSAGKRIKETRGSDAVIAALALLGQGVDLGGMKYGHRDELHER